MAITGKLKYHRIWWNITGKKRYHRIWWRLFGWTFPIMDPSEDPHDTVEIRGIPVDAELQELIEFLWSLGIATVNCCQGDPNLEQISGQNRFYEALVSFRSLDDANWFASQLEDARSTPYELGDLDIVQITYSTSFGSDGPYYHVSFPPSLIADFKKAISIPVVDPLED